MIMMKSESVKRRKYVELRKKAVTLLTLLLTYYHMRFDGTDAGPIIYRGIRLGTLLLSSY